MGREHRALPPGRGGTGGITSDNRVRRAGKLLRVLAQHLFKGPDPSRQTEALK